MESRILARASLVCSLAVVALAPSAAPARAAGGQEAPIAQAPPGPSEDGRFAREILWTETWDNRREALFIPEQVLRETPLESLPIGEGGRQALWLQLDGHEEHRAMLRERKGVEPPQCSRAPVGQAVPHEATTLERTIVDHSAFAFAGEVVEVVTGWNTSLRLPAESVYVRVDSVLHDPENRLLEGDILAYFQFVGEMRIGSRRLCTEPAPGQLVARAGEWLLVAGAPHLHEDRLIHADVRMRITDGAVQPSSSAVLVPMEPLSLRELEARIAVLQREDR
jgi:hypothetical protein